MMLYASVICGGSMCFLHFPSLCACPMQETVIPAPKAREEQVIPQELRRTPHRFTMFRASPQPLQSFFCQLDLMGAGMFQPPSRWMRTWGLQNSLTFSTV
jgi:hypothetical protein